MFRSAFHRRAARAALAVLWLLAGCGGYDRFDAAPVEEPARTDALAPFEAAQWPDHMHRLDLPRTRAMMADKSDDHFLAPDDIADVVYHLTQQNKSAWTFELDVRPFGESW